MDNKEIIIKTNKEELLLINYCIFNEMSRLLSLGIKPIDTAKIYQNINEILNELP